MANFPEIPVVIDTNVWSDLRGVLNLVQDKSKKDYKKIWEEMETNGRFVEDTLKHNKDELHAYRGAIKTMKNIVEMKKSPKKYKVEVPSYVFNEAERSVSSKISSLTKGSGKLENGLRGVLKSLPIEYNLDDTVLQEGTHYPGKILKHKQTIKGKMREFLEGNQEAELADLLNHLKNADVDKKGQVQKRSNKLKERINAVYHKRKNWDQFMIEASQVHGFTYETKTKALSALNGSIRRHRDVDDIFHKSDPARPGSRFGTKLHPLDVLAERLTMAEEECDFFDLKTYLYAKRKKAHIITMNTQAYQAINDPSFLGYFVDIKLLHPLINFDSLEDFEQSGDLLDIIEEAIHKDLKDLDMKICKELDKKLSKPIFEKEGGKLIKAALERFKTDAKNWKIDIPLGNVLKVLRIQNKQVKVNRESFFSDENGSLIIGRVAETLKFIDKQLFSNNLSSKDFVKSPNSNVDNALKSKVLKDYLDSNPRVKQKLDMEINRTKPRDYLNDLLSSFRKKTAIDIPTHLALTVQSQFSESAIKSVLNSESHEVPLPSSSCPRSGRIGKREAGECLLKWEHIEKFNDEKVQNRDPRKVKINSEKFLEYVKTAKDPQLRSQLIEFTDKVLNSVKGNVSKISGSMVKEVTHLVNSHKVLKHFSKVYRVSGALNYGIFAKSLLGDILNGNYEGIALNTGFMAGNFGFAKLSSASLAKGMKFAKTGKMMLGKSLKFASPFINRFLSPLIALDIYDQIQALKAGDLDAIVGIIGDGVLLAIDAVEIGITLLEISGLIGEVSAVTGPIGWALGALVIIGTDIYFAVRKVQSLDETIHLTTDEKWQIGAGSFFSFGLATFDVERLAHIKVGNNELAKKALEAIKNNQDVQRIVVPSGYANANDEIEIFLNNTFLANVEPSKLKWDRVRPDDPAGGTIFCAPQGDYENPPKGIRAKCVNAIGVADKVKKAKNFTLFNLGDGNDFVQGFKDSVNIFRIGKGKKQMIGGERSDVFVLEEGTTFKDFPEGFIDGKGGSNVFDYRGLKGEGNDAVSLTFKEDPIEATITHVTDYKTFRGKPVGSPKYSAQNLKILGIDSIIGRENEVDVITTNCNTKFVDSRGGRSDEPDVIYISYSDEECNHDKTIQLGSHTVVVNEAMAGKFSYFVNDVHSDIRCTLKRKTDERNDTDGPPIIQNNPIEHKFFINSTLPDVYKFNFQFKKGNNYDIFIGIYFKDEAGKMNRFLLDTILGYGKTEGGIYNIMFYLKDNVQLGYNHKGIYAFLKSDLPVDEIIKKYRPIAIAVRISVFIYAEEEGAMVSIGSDQADDVLYNDPSYKTYLIGNEGDNIYTITSGEDFLQDPPTIPKTEIHSTDRNNHIDTLNLRSLSIQIKEDLGRKLLIKHSFDSNKLVLNLYISDKFSYHEVTSIIFKNDDDPPNWDSWCNSLQIILNSSPVILKCDHDYQTTFAEGFDYERDFVNYDPSNYYRPLHLTFSHEDTIVIKEEDVEPYTEVFSKNKLFQDRYLRLENDLIMTNGFEFDTADYNPTTVVFKNYYENPTVFNTLKFIFKDRAFTVIEMESKINEAEKLEDFHNEYYNKLNDIIDHQPQRNKRDLGTRAAEEPSSSSEVIETRFSVSSVFGSVAQSLSNIYYSSLTYVQDYYVYMVESKPKHTLSPLQNFGIDFSNEPRVQNDRILESNPNAASSNENEIAFTDVNSTLLLLDTLVRKLNDSKHKQPVEDYLLSPQDQVEKKMVELSSKLELDLGDIEGSLEKQQQRILDNLTEE